MIDPAGPLALWARLALPWTLEATLVSAFAWIALTLLRRRSSHLRAGIAVLALVKTLLPPLLLPASLLPWRLALVPVRPDAGLDLASASVPIWLSALAAVHVAGILLGAGWCGLQLLGLRRLEAGSRALRGPAARDLAELTARLRLSSAPEARVASGVEVPFVTGLRRAKLFLPAHFAEPGWSERLAPVLAHELVHVRLRDPLVAWVGTLARVLWWFHPLVHLLARASEAAREERCDDVVLAEALAEPADYAQALLDVAERAVRRPRVAPPSFVHASLRRPGDFAARLVRITARTRRHRRRLSGLELVLLLAVAAVLLPATTRSTPTPRAGETVRYVHIGDAAGGVHGHGHRHHSASSNPSFDH